MRASHRRERHQQPSDNSWLLGAALICLFISLVLAMCWWYYVGR